MSIFSVSQISDGCMYKLSMSDEFMHEKGQIILSSHAAPAPQTANLNNAPGATKERLTDSIQIQCSQSSR